jgi:hypothetical protein
MTGYRIVIGKTAMFASWYDGPTFSERKSRVRLEAASITKNRRGLDVVDGRAARCPSLDEIERGAR